MSNMTSVRSTPVRPAPLLLVATLLALALLSPAGSASAATDPDRPVTSDLINSVLSELVSIDEETRCRILGGRIYCDKLPVRIDPGKLVFPPDLKPVPDPPCLSCPNVVAQPDSAFDHHVIDIGGGPALVPTDPSVSVERLTAEAGAGS